MDMLRFDRFTAGRYWVDDYGYPDREADFRILRAYSPYHNIRPGVRYPPMLATTADTDDRVVPGHSFKYIAALQAADAGPAPHLIRIETRAGHGSGKPTDKQIEEYTDMYAFIAHYTGLRWAMPPPGANGALARRIQLPLSSTRPTTELIETSGPPSPRRARALPFSTLIGRPGEVLRIFPITLDTLISALAPGAKAIRVGPTMLEISTSARIERAERESEGRRRCSTSIGRADALGADLAGDAGEGEAAVDRRDRDAAGDRLHFDVHGARQSQPDFLAGADASAAAAPVLHVADDEPGAAAAHLGPVAIELALARRHSNHVDRGGVALSRRDGDRARHAFHCHRRAAIEPEAFMDLLAGGHLRVIVMGMAGRDGGQQGHGRSGGQCYRFHISIAPSPVPATNVA